MSVGNTVTVGPKISTAVFSVNFTTPPDRAGVRRRTHSSMIRPPPCPGEISRRRLHSVLFGYGRGRLLARTVGENQGSLLISFWKLSLQFWSGRNTLPRRSPASTHRTQNPHVLCDHYIVTLGGILGERVDLHVAAHQGIDSPPRLPLSCPSTVMPYSVSMPRVRAWLAERARSLRPQTTALTPFDRLRSRVESEKPSRRSRGEFSRSASLP